MAQYERLQEILSKHLGTEPGSATERLRDEVASGEFPFAPSSTTGPTQEEEELLESPRHNLPAPRTSFVGREQEVVEVKCALSTTRLLTLTGAGDSGKTKLALEVARSHVGAYPEGVWIVELALLSEEELPPKALTEPGDNLLTSCAYS